MQDAARYAAVDDLDAWVRASGGRGLDGVRVALSASGLGLETSRDVKRGDVLIGVPETLALTAEWTLRSAIGEALAAFDPELGDYTFLALGLLHERRMGAESPLAPWVASAVWPDDPDVPLLWDAGAQADLAASTSAPLAERLAGAAADYAWLEENALAADPGLFPRDGFSREAFLGALATAFSRSVIVRKDGFDLPALCPLLDLANHADDAPPGAAPPGGGTCAACSVVSSVSTLGALTWSASASVMLALTAERKAEAAAPPMRRRRTSSDSSAASSKRERPSSVASPLSSSVRAWWRAHAIG